MFRYTSAVLVVAALLTPDPARAQPADGSPAVTTGLFLSAHVDGAALVVNDGSDTLTGPGASLTIGYGLMPGFAVLASLSGARLTGGLGEPFALDHLDLAGRWHLGPRRRLVPHLDLGVTHRVTSLKAPGRLARVPSSRTTIGVGVGLNYYFRPTVAIGGTLKYGIGDVAGNDCPTTGSRTCAASTRVQLGLSWFPR